MRKMMKFVSLTLCGAMLLAGCGKADGENTGSKAEGKDNAGNIFEDTTEEQNKECALSDYFMTGEDRIWYEMDNESGIRGKDSELEYIYYCSNGTIHVYNGNGRKLGDFARMSDEEIVAELDRARQEEMETRKNDFNEAVQNDINRCDALIADLPDTMEFTELGSDCVFTGFENVKARLKEYRDELSAMLEVSTDNDNECTDFTYSVYTDASGNVVSKEQISGTYTTHNYQIKDAQFLTDLETMNELYKERSQGIPEDENDAGTWLIHYINAVGFDLTQVRDQKPWEMHINDLPNIVGDGDDVVPHNMVTEEEQTFKIDDINTGMGNFQVYDSTYVGYSCKDYERCLVTRSDDKLILQLDDVNSPNVQVDPN